MHNIYYVDVRTSLWRRIFSKRERWFDRHRNCEVSEHRRRGWDGSHLYVFHCETVTCKHYMRGGTWTDVFPHW